MRAVAVGAVLLAGVAAVSGCGGPGGGEAGTTVRESTIVDNDNADAPAIREGFSGGGVGIAGGRDNVIADNRITGNDGVGVLIVSHQGYRAAKNTVTGNRIEGHDVDVVSVVRSAGCFSGNSIGTSIPDDIQRVVPCSGRATVAPSRRPYTTPKAPPDVDYTKIPLPPKQPSMPRAAG